MGMVTKQKYDANYVSKILKYFGGIHFNLHSMMQEQWKGASYLAVEPGWPSCW